MNIWRDCPQVFVCLSVAKITRADNLLYLPGYKELLEFGWEVVDTMRDVKVANDKYQNHRGRR